MPGRRGHKTKISAGYDREWRMKSGFWFYAGALGAILSKTTSMSPLIFQNYSAGIGTLAR
jgi:hypothetical protein